MSNPVPNSLALGTMSGEISASPHNSNYSAVQTAVNALIVAAGGGTVGQVLAAVDTTHTQFAYPPGYEYDYHEFTSPTTISSTTEAGAFQIRDAAAITFDGATAVMIEFYAPYFTTATSGDQLVLCLYDGSSSIGLIGSGQATTGYSNEIYVRRRITPSAATHTYSIRGYRVGTSNITVGAGLGGVGAYEPGFIKITKA